MKTTNPSEMRTSDLLEAARMMSAIDLNEPGARDWYNALHAECVKRDVQDQINPEEDEQL